MTKAISKFKQHTGFKQVHSPHKTIPHPGKNYSTSTANRGLRKWVEKHFHISGKKAENATKMLVKNEIEQCRLFMNKIRKEQKKTTEEVKKRIREE